MAVLVAINSMSAANQTRYPSAKWILGSHNPKCRKLLKRIASLGLRFGSNLGCSFIFREFDILAARKE
jgi:hypothetical protein